MNLRAYKKQFAGFTLIELMITVTIIGVVAAIAYPSYNKHIMRKNRLEGKAMLEQAVADQERYFSTNNTYASTTTMLGYQTNPAISKHGYYQLSVDTPTGSCPIETCFSLTLEVHGTIQSADTDCEKFTQASDGRRSVKNAFCWER
ncbi:MAG: type IV pilin protein [Gammaproteobacteria bacterium]